MIFIGYLISIITKHFLFYFFKQLAVANVNVPIPSIDLEMSQHAMEEAQKMNFPERTFDNSTDIVSNSNKNKPKMYAKKKILKFVDLE